jgi:phosphate transport system permease protein
MIAAVLLGFGRAIGETMILLLLSGNAADAGFNPFTAVRSIAATLAIELPDAAVASTHFQVLVLAALMLFAVSFVFNTIAQVLKRRLMNRIGQVLS